MKPFGVVYTVNNLSRMVHHQDQAYNGIHISLTVYDKHAFLHLGVVILKDLSILHVNV